MTSQYQDRSAPDPPVDPRGDPFLGTRFTAPGLPPPSCAANAWPATSARASARH
ncbi:hypothetical protein [Streptomyces sp. NPDC001270]|uniref:hypothetical protein n=1 Tax=Streptomyces sp. NPDC001270 TaxID=3364554 RepID=UPI00368B54B5